jgi:hypothetical protein
MSSFVIPKPNERDPAVQQSTPIMAVEARQYLCGRTEAGFAGGSTSARQGGVDRQRVLSTSIWKTSRCYPSVAAQRLMPCPVQDHRSPKANQCSTGSTSATGQNRRALSVAARISALRNGGKRQLLTLLSLALARVMDNIRQPATLASVGVQIVDVPNQACRSAQWQPLDSALNRMRTARQQQAARPSRRVKKQAQIIRC